MVTQYTQIKLKRAFNVLNMIRADIPKTLRAKGVCEELEAMMLAEERAAEEFRLLTIAAAVELEDQAANDDQEWPSPGEDAA